MMNNRGVSIIDAILTFTITIVIGFIFIFAFGTLLDTYIFEFQGLYDGTLSLFLVGPLEDLMTLAEWVFIVPIFFMFLVGFWLFKTVIQKHKYSRYEEEEEEW